jgi:hypothetical protein
MEYAEKNLIMFSNTAGSCVFIPSHPTNAQEHYEYTFFPKRNAWADACTKQVTDITSNFHFYFCM